MAKVKPGQKTRYTVNVFTRTLIKPIQLCLHTMYTVLVLRKLKKKTATAPQPQRNALKYFSIFKNVVHSLEPDETPSK